MCGIAGKLWFDPGRAGDGPAAAALGAALAHRGPDGSGIAVDGPVALAHRRLAIIDLSPRARQPMRSVDGRDLLVVNGEIWNHAELRAELSARGHRFLSDSDSEVLLPLMREWWDAEGPRCFDRLEGMYAFALWDGAARRLILGRDRVGKKPLVYARTAEALVFASELAALRREPLVDRTLDEQALSDLLAHRVVPHPATIWKGARKLPPGSVLVAEQGRTTVHRTWRLAPGSDASEPPSLDEAAEEVRARLAAAVRRRLMSDVPLGAFLSGGLDSAAVVALMAQAGVAPLRTYTIGFAEAGYDERVGARKVAQLFGTEHHEELVQPDAVALLGDIVRHHGEPFADSSSIPMFLLSRIAARDVKVVLTGDGGDESFAGYDRYRALALAARLDGPLAAPLRAAVSGAAALGRLAGALGAAGGGRSAAQRLLRFAEALPLSPRRRNHRWRLGLSPGLRERLLTPDAQRRLPPPGFHGADLPGALPLNEALVTDVERYLPDDPLVKVDIATMASGLEARCPLLDRQLMEYVAALPGRYKLGRADGAPAAGTRAQSKLVLRRALAPLLPADVLHGPKRGFGVPLDAWFRGPLAEHARQLLLAPRAVQRGWFRPQAVEELIEGHARRRFAAHEPLYTLLVLETWFLQQESAA